MASLFSTLMLAAKRVWNHRLLMLCLLAGLVAAVGLLSSIPLYADAVHHRLLQGELTEAGTHRPPFAFLWRYIGTWHGTVGWEEYRQVDEYLSGQATDVIGLPLAVGVRHVKTDNMRLFAAADSAAFGDREPLLWTALGFISGLEQQVEMVEGDPPSGLALGGGEGDVGVVVSQGLAERMGLQMGERYVLFGSDSGDSASSTGGPQVPVRVMGIWQPREPTDPFWFYQPSSFEDLLLTSEAAFETQVVPLLEKPVSVAVWYQVFDGSRVRGATVQPLLGQVAAAESRAEALLAHASLDVSPTEALNAYRQAARLLTVLLTVFGIPVVGLILYFVALIAGMVVRRDQGEIAILRSRGTSRLQVLLVYLLEGLLLGGLGLAGGLVLGRLLAQLMSRSRTFLDPAVLELGFLPGTGSMSELLPIALSPEAVGYGLLAVGLAVLALLLPALAASGHTIVTFKWQRARALLRPLWQRYYLDLLLIAVPFYGWYLLQQQGTIALLGGGLGPLGMGGGDPFSNPLLFLVPALFCFSLSLLFVRAFPWLMHTLAWLAAWLPGTTLLLTLRGLARSAGQYTGPLLLLSLTLSLATFTASMAATLDGHLWDQVYYQTGADLNLAEMGESTEEAEGSSLLGQTAPAPSPEDDEEEPRWLFLPVSEHLRVPGVQAAARVGDYGVASNIGGRQQNGRILGVDRLDFPAAAYYRIDFAGGEALAGLMNRLAVGRANLLVSRDFLVQHSLRVGDPLRLTVGVAGEFQEIDFLVAGPLDLFPTVYPQDGPFFVGNLEYIHEGLGGTFPYDVWLATDPSVPGEQIMNGVRDLGLAIAASSDARASIADEQTRPERQGLFGLLSVGFLAAAALTVLGFLVYAVVSFQRRFIELGILRAVGLSVGQMAAYLAGEQAMLILVGGGLGTALGIWASQLFIPFLQVGLGKTALVPPFVVQIAWQELWIILAIFGIMFVVAVVVLVGLLLRMRIFEAVKLGEAG